MSSVPFRFVRNEAVLFSEVGDDIVALSVARGECFGMADVSAEVWRLLAHPSSLEEICARIEQFYDVDQARCRSDVAELLDNMQAKGLIVSLSEPEQAA